MRYFNSIQCESGIIIEITNDEELKDVMEGIISDLKLCSDDIEHINYRKIDELIEELKEVRRYVYGKG